MRKITFVGTVHDENGLCNVEELLKILREIEPEVVFEELRPSEFDFYYSHGKLEPRAIKKYREFRTFQEVPVDRYDAAEMGNLHDEIQRVFEYLDQTNQEYYQLKEKEEINSNKYGFGYLNNIAYEKLMARLSEIEDKTIAGLGNQGFFRVLEKWRRITLSRELEMVRNIYEYSGEKVFDTGVFLVGASHKRGIVREIQKHAAMEAHLINWDFAYGKTP